MKLSKSFWALFLLLLPLCLKAQKVNFQFYTTEDGLTGNSSNSFMQDWKGFLWLINDSKLHRFDGRKFEMLLPPSDLEGSDEPLIDGKIIQDSLLVALGKKHLLILNIEKGKWKSCPLPPSNNRLRYYSLLPGKGQKKLFLLEFSEGLGQFNIWSFSGDRLGVSPVHVIENPDFDTHIIGSDGSVYFLNANLEGKGGNQFGVWIPNRDSIKKNQIKGLAKESYIRDISLQKDGSFLFNVFYPNEASAADSFGYIKFYTWNPVTDVLKEHPINRSIHFSGIYLFRFLALNNGDIWMSGRNRQLFWYEAAEDSLHNFTPQLQEVISSNLDINEPYADHSGSIWFGTHLGFFKADQLETPIVKYFHASLDVCKGNCSFRGIEEDSVGNIVAQFYQGLVYFNPAKAKDALFFDYESSNVPLPSDVVRFKNKLWLHNGCQLDIEQRKIIPIPGAKENHVWEEGLLAKSLENRLWWVQANELLVLSEGEEGFRWQKVKSFPNPDFAANEAFHFGKQSGMLYIGREGKLFQYAPLTKEERWFDFKQIYGRELRVMAIEEDKQRNLWLATDAGLMHFNPQTVDVKQYTKQEGLPHDFVCGMLTEGDTALWLSTNHGLSRFSKASESFINFYKEDGLTDNEFNRKSYFKAKDGRMYFGGLKGINAFYPNELLSNFQQQSEQAQLSLASFEYTDEKEGKTHHQLNFSAKAEIEIYYHHRSFTFEYALTDYRNASEIAYSYRMKGYENTWSIPSKFNFTRFSSLPEGEYEFEVKAKDSHGIWHPNQLSVKVIVYPPWWASWWAYLMYAFLILGILYTIYTFLSKRWELQQKLRVEQEEAIRLKNLDSFKSKLYTNLTHEFRTPLTVILGMADQIKNQPEKYLDKGTNLIKSNGMNLLRLINQLLDLSKLEDKSFQLRLENGDFVSYLRYITESFQTFANTQNISLRFQSREDELLMDFDPEQIKQLMTNLISNAIKFTPSGGGVQVELKKLDELSTAQIVVKDNGIGIEKKNLPHIFERFYQVDGSITREGEGSGIGLTHTLELVKLMNGTIEVSSEPNQGTSFIILFPIQDRLEYNPNLIQKELRSKVDAQKAVHTELNIADPVPDASSHPSILIIEDNVDVVDYLKACLEDQFQLSVAFNGRIGIEKALEEIPDLIVSDVMMPEKDGYEVCDSLKNDIRTSHIPIILLTAKADISSKISGLRRGADAYLAKPFVKEELIVRLEQLIERQERMIRHFSTQAPLSSKTFGNGLNEAIQQEDLFIQKVRNIIDENYADEDFGLPQLCRKIGMSRSQLYRKMKALIDIPPSDFIRNYRLEQAKLLLQTSELTVSEVAWKVGFKDLSHFSKAYQAMFGVLPSATSK